MMLKRVIALSQSTLKTAGLLFIAVAALTLGSPAAQACISGRDATVIYNQAIATANTQFTSAQDQALAQLDFDRVQAKAAYDTAMSQPGDDHSSDHYNQAISDLNQANAQAELVYNMTVTIAQKQCQADFDLALKQYHTNTCS